MEDENLVNEIIAALILADPHDLNIIHRYIAWVKFRRKVNDMFFSKNILSVKYHWVR